MDVMNEVSRTDRRSFLYQAGAAATATFVLPQASSLAFAASNSSVPLYRTIEDGLPVAALGGPSSVALNR